MIDRRAYCETFSQLRASGDAKREALERMRHQRIKKKPRPLRVLGLTAAVVAALCVTAGAVNLATDGALFRQFRVVWQDDSRLELQDAEGNRVSAALVGENLVTREEGRLILHAGGEDMDITDAMAARGYYHYAYDMTVIHGDGAQEAVHCFCHGDFQHHNLLCCRDGFAVINFEKYLLDNPVRDLYLFLRKLLEKNSWSPSLALSILTAYETQRTLSDQDRRQLYYRFAYPEKFWKIVNFYYNSGKAWIPGRNREKLENLLRQEEEKKAFLDSVLK